MALFAPFSSVKKYATGLTILLFVVGFGGYAVMQYGLKSPIAYLFPVLTLLVYLVTLVTHMILFQANTERPQKFVNMYMLSSGFKMFLYLIIMMVYAFLNKDKGTAVPFVLSFFVLYLIFTVYDVRAGRKAFNKK